MLVNFDLKTDIIVRSFVNYPQVEKTRHSLLLRGKLAEENRFQELTKLDKDAANRFQKKMTSSTTTNRFVDGDGGRGGGGQGDEQKDNEILSEKEREKMTNEMEKSQLQTNQPNETIVGYFDRPQHQQLVDKCLKLLTKNRFSNLFKLQTQLHINNAMVRRLTQFS